ncbi:MAG: F0F1 ATP synthase subunit B [Acidimicrobiia bacterium]|nr:F0F1 ATP synthase subunit B [Acidimicrobiia bacterium]
MQYVLAQVLYLAAAEEEPEGIDLVIPEINELIAGVIAFAIVFTVVWVWGRPALNRTLEARQDAITGQLKEAEQAKAEAESLLADYRQQLADARAEADRIISEARETAQAQAADIVSKAEAEAEATREKAREDAAAERARLAGTIQSEVASLSMDIARKVTAGAIDEQASRAIVDDAISRISGAN